MQQNAFILWVRKPRIIAWIVFWGLLSIGLGFTSHDNTVKAQGKLATWTRTTGRLLTIQRVVSKVGTSVSVWYATTVQYETPGGTVVNKLVVYTEPKDDRATLYYDPANPHGYIDSESTLQATVASDYQVAPFVFFPLGIILVIAGLGIAVYRLSERLSPTIEVRT